MLDPSSATELLTQTSSTTLEPTIKSKQQQSIKESTERILSGSRSKYAMPQAPPMAAAAYYTEDIYCKSHPDEEVKYFCFDCLTPPVCSECVVHGIHKGHEVLHIKKAFPLIKDKLEGVIQGLSTSVEDLEGDRKGLINKKQLVAAQADDIKSQIKTVMDDLRTRIDKKERELMGHIDIVTGDALKELESYERVVEDKLATLANNVKYIQENMAGGPLSTLCFYSDNYKLLTQAAEQERKDPYVARLISANPVNPEGTLREIKDAATAVNDAIGRVKISAGKSVIVERTKETATGKKGSRDSSIEAALGEEYS